MRSRSEMRGFLAPAGRGVLRPQVLRGETEDGSESDHDSDGPEQATA